jgi:hypothetical protein
MRQFLLPVLLLSPLVVLHCGTEGGQVVTSLDGAVASDGEPQDLPDGSASSDAEGPRVATEGAGSRFFPRSRVEEYSDGSKRSDFVGFYDRVRGEDCKLREVSPGSFRCLPEVEPFAFSPAYKDAACTQPILTRPISASVSKPYVSLGAPCAVQIGKLGPKISVSTAYFGSAARCAELAGGTANVDAYDLPAPVPLSDFGEFVRNDESRASSEETASARLGLRGFRFTSSDGAFTSQEPVVLDRALDSVNVGARLGFDAKLRLLPNVEGSDSLFTESTCTTPAVLFQAPSTCSSDPNQSADGRRTEMINGCTVTRMFPAPPSMTLPSLTTAFDGSGTAPFAQCRAFGPIGGSRAVYPQSALTERVASTFSEIAVTDTFDRSGSTGTQLEPRRVTWSGADGFRLQKRSSFFVDKATQTRCQDIQQAEDPARCIPEGPSGFPVYSDAACTKEVFVVLTDPCVAAKPSPFIRTFEVDRFAIFRRPPEAPTRLTNIYSKSGATCRAITAYDLSRVDVYPVAAVVRIPMSTFPARTRFELTPAP